ncbi:MAG: thioredoxin domain-containing protein [Myxococcota bacterium]
MIGLVGWAVLACVTPKNPSTTESAAEAASSCMPGMPAVVAEIDGRPITCEELLEYAGPQIVEAQVEAANRLQNAIDSMIVERLLEAKSDEQGLAIEDIIKREVDDKVDEPTDAEIEALYSENAAQMEDTLEAVKPQLAEFLKDQQRGPLFRQYVAQLEEESKVVRQTTMFRMPVEAGTSPRWGKESAKVQVIEFSDFQCPACQQAAPIVDSLKAKFGDKLSVVFRHLPLPRHPQAARAAQAAECANEQGKFWEYHDKLFADQKAWTDDDFKGLAAELGLSDEDFGSCLSSDRHVNTVRNDETAAVRAGVNGTPAFFVNGIPVFGVPPEDVFVELIQRELDQAM